MGNVVQAWLNAGNHFMRLIEWVNEAFYWCLPKVAPSVVTGLGKTDTSPRLLYQKTISYFTKWNCRFPCRTQTRAGFFTSLVTHGREKCWDTLHSWSWPAIFKSLRVLSTGCCTTVSFPETFLLSLMVLQAAIDLNGLCCILQIVSVTSSCRSICQSMRWRDKLSLISVRRGRHVDW